MFSDIAANYTLTVRSGPNPNHAIIVSHLAGAGADGTDIVYNIERLAFTDQTITTGAFFDTPASGVIVITGRSAQRRDADRGSD